MRRVFNHRCRIPVPMGLTVRPMGELLELERYFANDRDVKRAEKWCEQCAYRIKRWRTAVSKELARDPKSWRGTPK